MNWFTSDLHLGHGNIIKYCNRPFENVHEMNKTIINNWNSRVKDNDTVYHLGDFCFRGGICGTDSATYWRSQLKGNIVFLRGNHDKNNGLKTLLTKAILDFSNKIVLIQHHPPTMELEIPEFCDLVLCGHVHDKWKHRILNVPIINVSVDQWRFMPIHISEILGYVSREKLWT